MNKKANQKKLRAIKNSQAIMKNYTITLVMCNKENQCSAVYYKGKPTKVSPQLAWHFENTRIRWNILCGVICRNQQQEHYINYVYFGSLEECDVNALSELAYNYCKTLFDKALYMHKLCPFYLASPDEIDPLLILDTIKKYKALNIIGTNFEFDCNMPQVDFHTTENWIKVLETIKFNQINLEELNAT